MTRDYYQQVEAKPRLQAAEQSHESARQFIAGSAAHTKHERRLPGRVAKHLAEADRYLQQAQWAFPALLEGKQQKMAIVAFNNALKLAHLHNLLAVVDPYVMTGHKSRPGRVKGAETTNAKIAGRRHIPIIKMLARCKDEWDWVPPRELWPTLFSELDALRSHPKEYGEGQAAYIEYEGGRVTRQAFERMLRRERNPDNAQR